MLAVLYFGYRGSFGFVRNAVFAAMAISVIGYALFPTAPPRFLPELGLDSVDRRDGQQPALASRATRSSTRSRPCPRCTSASVILPGRWRMLVAARAPGAALRLSAADDLRRGRQRQPLLAGCRLRPARRPRSRSGVAILLARVNPDWSFGGPAPHVRRRRAPAGARGGARLAADPDEHRPARPSANGPPRRRRDRPPRRELSAAVRNRLIESRLTPNAISIAGLVVQPGRRRAGLAGLYFLGGVAFIVGSVMDTLDGRYARVSGKGTLFGAFLDSTLDRVEEGIVLTAVAYRFALNGDEFAAACASSCARLADGLLHAGARRGARRRVQGRVGHAPRPGSHTLDRPRLRQGRRSLRCRAAGPGDLR